jgi:hypothetical protein
MLATAIEACLPGHLEGKAWPLMREQRDKWETVAQGLALTAPKPEPEPPKSWRDLFRGVG